MFVARVYLDLCRSGAQLFTSTESYVLVAERYLYLRNGGRAILLYDLFVAIKAYVARGYFPDDSVINVSIFV